MSAAWDGLPPEEWREKCAWHWFETPHGDRIPILWNYTRWEKNALPNLRTEDCWQAHECRYLAPCLSPDEIAALRARAERAEAMLELTQKNMITAQEHATKAEKEVWAAMRTARAEALREAAERANRWIAVHWGKGAAGADDFVAAITALSKKEKPDGA